MVKEEDVILVDVTGLEIGIMGKMEAHLQGKLHRAFSVFIFNSKGELLMQQRADDKYHSGGLWTNSCCSHPRQGEETIDAALRRLQEEMGIACELEPVFSFVYKAKLDHGLTEHEFDYVFFGSSNELPKINKTEVKDWKYMSMDNLEYQIKLNPDHYTEWLKDCFVKVYNAHQNYIDKHNV